MLKRFLFLVLIVIGCFFSKFSLAEPNTAGEAVTKNVVTGDKGTKDAQDLSKYVDASAKGLVNAKFTCPRYLLLWSMGIYDEGAKEDASKILKVAKDMAQLAKENLLKYPDGVEQKYYSEKLKDPQLKQKMIAYIDNVIQAAIEQEKYFNSDDDKDISAIDKYLKDASAYDKDIEAMLGEPIASGNKAVSDTIWMCPRWFTTFAETYYASNEEALRAERKHKGKSLACDSCVKIIESAKTINEVSMKAIVTDDTKLKEKISAYVNALSKMNDAYIEFYKTGNRKLADTPYKYRSEALSVEEDMNNYLTSKQEEKQ